MRKACLALGLAVLCVSADASDDRARVGHSRLFAARALPCLQAVAARHGLVIDERLLPRAADVIPALLGGQVDAALVPVADAVSARAAGIPVLILAGFAPAEEHIVARKALGVKSFAAVAGHRVGVPRAGSEELLLLTELRGASLTWSVARDADVQLVYLPAQDLDGALRSGYVDAIVQNDSLTRRALQGGYGVEIPRTTGGSLQVLVTTEGLYRERRLIEPLVKSIVQAARDVQPHIGTSPAGTQLVTLDLHRCSSSPFAITEAYVDDTAQRMVALGVGRLDAAPPAREFMKLDLAALAGATWEE